MVREKIMRTKMEQKEKGQHFSKTMNKFTIQSVTTLIGRIKKCQAYSNDVLESKTKANGVKNKNGLLDKNAEEKKASFKTVATHDDTESKKRMNLIPDTNGFHASYFNRNSKIKTPEFKTDMTLNDGGLKEIESECFLGNISDKGDTMIDKLSGKTQNVLPQGVQNVFHLFNKSFLWYNRRH